MTSCCGQEKYKDGQNKNDRRQQLIDGIKALVGDMDSKDGSRGRPLKRGGGPEIPGVRNMDDECRQYRKRRECTPPLITSLAIHEIRPTSDYSNKQHENTSQWTYVDATRQDMLDPMPPAPWDLPRTPSQELRASTLYQSCDCRRRNGLQHDCQRWDCGGRPTCLAINPGPCCEPSKARKPVRGDRRYPPGSGTGGSGGVGGVGGEASSGQQQCCGGQPKTQVVSKNQRVQCDNTPPVQTGPKGNQVMGQEFIGIVALGADGPVGFMALAPPGIPPQVTQMAPPPRPVQATNAPQPITYLCCPLS